MRDQPAAAPSHSRPLAQVSAKGHPRLWVRRSDLAELRRRASDKNPLYRALRELAAEARGEMKKGLVPRKDSGGTTWVQYPTENYAELMAFMSLIAPEKERAGYARSARELLMYAIDRAAKPPADDKPFRDPDFATDDRSRWWGEAWALTVDWIYDALSARDKKTIRRVFLRWVAANRRAKITTDNHPEPRGRLNDKALISDRERVRWSSNNYYAAHTRNIGLMALALDEKDDPKSKLRSALNEAIGAWLYVTDDMLRNDARGGLTAEGSEYAPQTVSYIGELMLALYTAGEAKPRKWGRQVAWDKHPFWKDMVHIYPHTLSPKPGKHAWRGAMYLPAWYGDGQKYGEMGNVDLLGPLGYYDALTGAKKQLEAIRWMVLHLPVGGADGLFDRIERAGTPRSAILHFLLYEPGRPKPRDPRPDYPLAAYAPGLGHIYARTDWSPQASWFHYTLGWITVDHQHADGNNFGLYRKGEWLTKERTGYGHDSFATSDNHNTLTIENDRPRHHDEGDYRTAAWKAGSQWVYVNDGAGEITAHSLATRYVYAAGDATKLYNSRYEKATAVAHASRAIVWLKPDTIVVLDRARTKKSGRAIRFWLQLPSKPSIDGSRAVAATPKGQKLHIATLLPRAARLTPLPARSDAAKGDPMSFRLRVDVADKPRAVTMLHVLQGTDTDASAASVQLLGSNGGTPYVGARVGDTAVLFPRAPRSRVKSVRYTVPAAVAHHLITGLAPRGRYTVSRANKGESSTIELRRGGKLRADGGGVLYWP